MNWIMSSSNGGNQWSLWLTFRSILSAKYSLHNSHKGRLDGTALVIQSFYHWLSKLSIFVAYLKKYGGPDLLAKQYEMINSVLNQNACVTEVVCEDVREKSVIAMICRVRKKPSNFLLCMSISNFVVISRSMRQFQYHILSILYVALSIEKGEK